MVDFVIVVVELSIHLSKGNHKATMISSSGEAMPLMLLP